MIRGGRAVQKSGHVREYLLCASCEQRFGDVEPKVSKIARQPDGSRPMLDLLGNAVLATDGGNRVVLPGKVNTAELCYFGASILWRSSVADRVSSCSLGNEHNEKFRTYLLGTSQFPDTAACLVTVLHEDDDLGPLLATAFSTPATEHFVGHDTHRFLVGGFVFNVFTGHALPDLA